MKYSGFFLPVAFVCSSGSASTACTLFAGKIWRERMPCDSHKLQYTRCFTYILNSTIRATPENVHGTVYVSPLKQSLSRANHKGVNNSVTGLHGDRLCGFPMHAEQLTVI